MNQPATRAADRDIELVLLTGAGASREFGMDGKPLPLMGDWSSLVVRKLVENATQFWDLTTLRDKLTGPEFELALGKFLKHAEAFATLTDLAPALARASVPGAPAPPQFEQWYASMKFALDKITTSVVESLVEQFNYPRVSSLRAGEAFTELLKHMEISVRAPIVWATTNYDPIAEMALIEMGRRPECGEPPSFPWIAQRPLDVAGLLAGLPRQTPVLHLHGKVGWYRDPRTGLAMHRQLGTHDPSLGVPVVMLPAPDKSYAGDDVLTIIWSEFTAALERARRVLVLGHSLNDVLLVEALHAHVPPARLAIVVYGDGKGGVDPSAIAQYQRIGNEFPGVPQLALQFGPKIGGDATVLTNWSRQVGELG